MKSDNTLVTNDYVISEYLNRSCKIQYLLKYKGEQDPWRFYKARRKAGDLKSFMDDVRDICHDILRDCEFENAITSVCPIGDHITENAQGLLDFSDIVIREHCARMDYVLVSDDGDFADCGLELVTSNPHILRTASVNGQLVA